MGISRQQLKLRAKVTIQETKPSPILFSALYVAILLLFSFLQTRLAGIDRFTYDDIYRMIENMADMEWFFDHFSITPQAGILLFAVWIVTTLISAGFSIYALRVSRKIPSGFGTILDGFGMTAKILGVVILRAVFITLWSLLLFIPGIIAMYRYRQALYIQLDHPDWSPLSCIRASKQMMRGRKMELFVLDFSFLLWNLLTGAIYVGLLISVWVYIYQELTYVHYYNSLLANPFYQYDQNGNAYWNNHE